MRQKLQLLRLQHNTVFSRSICWTITLICYLATAIYVIHLRSLQHTVTAVPTSKLLLTNYVASIASAMKVNGIACKDLFSSSHNVVNKLNASQRHIGTPITDIEYVDLASKCSRFQKTRGYIMLSLTEEEEEFPLAYSLLVYKDLEMVERLLRAIYRPQNYYCVHVDQKSTVEFYSGMSAIVSCFPNVFLTSVRISVRWGTFSVLEPELLCMKELWRYPKWKYFINLTGQEFALKTNFELVRILKAFNGAIDVSTWRKRINFDRWNNTTPPFGIKPMKGPVHIVVHREFVNYVLNNSTAAALLKWTKSTKVPDETFFATLNANPQLGIKGTYLEPEMTVNRPYIARCKIRKWMANETCAGRYVRGVCILSTGDLPRLGKAREMFANKFFLNEDRLVIGCLEEKLFNDTRDEFIGTKYVDTSYYSQLDFVKNQVT
ncbi:unnamed protein product [Candidula unifasciata]|uniref:Beta-1,3-galactosyl-O-glycosyl-glycoprotein beta-1,6-N-acetylglucosaminyltransferase n=1 Tax=Candidula unifasciata TaxID=100452 RepID=A0A8S3YDK9_9EUPU|nr:unnamed protein product [Candidula unifasciata]